MNSTIVISQSTKNATSFVMSVSDSKWHFNFAKGIDEKLPQERGKANCLNPWPARTLPSGLLGMPSSIADGQSNWGYIVTAMALFWPLFLSGNSCSPQERIYWDSHTTIFKHSPEFIARTGKKLPSYLCHTFCFQSSCTKFIMSFCVMFTSTLSIGWGNWG